MKYRIIITTSIAVALYSFTGNAGDVTGLTTYIGGTTLNASDLNNDNTQIKSAVDHNNSNIELNATNIDTKQNRVAEEGCPAEQSIRVINGDGTVTCEVDDDSGGDITSVDTAVDSGLTGGRANGSVNLKLANGFVSVHPSAFRSRFTYDTLCYPVTEKGYHYFFSPSTSSICGSYAPVNLPHNADITSITCYFRDNHATQDITVNFWRTTLSTGTSTNIATLDTFGANTTAMLTRTSNFASQIVNNGLYAYSIAFIPGDTTLVSLDHRIYGCFITYSY